MRGHKIRVAFEPRADFGDGGVFADKGAVAVVARGDFEAGDDPWGLPAEDAGEFGGV
jgi:hypothetical protein